MKKIIRTLTRIDEWKTSRKERKQSKPLHQRYSPLLNPIFQGIFWFFTFVLGAFASLFAENIKGNISLGNIFSAQDSSIWQKIVQLLGSLPILFWGFFFIALLLAFIFGTTAWIKSRREDYMYHSMQTNPPQNFWQLYEETSWEIKQLHEDIQGIVLGESPKEKEIDSCYEGVRTMLDGIINLVKAWDVGNIERNIVYRANIMEVVYFKDNPEYQLPVLDNVDRFIHMPVTQHYSGVIKLLNNSFTTSSNTPKSEPDRERKPIVFPFCLKEDNSTHKYQTNLRGAPYCVATESIDYVSTISDVTDHYINTADPKSKRITANLKQYYFLKDNPAQSILSIPLRERVEESTSGHLVERNNQESLEKEVNNLARTKKIRWVLNIYRNQPGLLYGTWEKNKQFTQVITSLIGRIEDVLDIMDTLPPETIRDK
ncbi:hypothetical protein [Vibrio cyclitrophicus]|uniref:hypothetical protein n=1 Tax=Vibrio cyclitrophicus TaxID=47951 RepID=UPI0002D45A67|nr:hypothetical protein [Vibrio cyclitrophicus]ERM59586.1 hypothetical protein M565_ctg3P151 [Vibrio cyclitrophicus FF75]OEE46220.1 hypothetical protein OAG_14785 [Vibrio cyclitrophicus FF75]